MLFLISGCIQLIIGFCDGGGLMMLLKWRFNSWWHIGDTLGVKSGKER